MDEDRLLQDAQALGGRIRSAKQIVVLTGAGISTESGIPDFRSPGGLWSRYQPITYQEFLTSKDARRRYWQYRKEIYPEFAAARPNAGHLVLVELERRGKLQALITQNIDGLHEAAGNSPSKIIELHSTERWVACLTCGERWTRVEAQERLEAGEDILLCGKCGGILKPATISFGQSLLETVIRQAFAESEHCEAFLVIGSSLVVHPAAQLPVAAKRRGAWLGILNRDPTPVDGLADWRSRLSAGHVLSAAITALDGNAT
jgi:NAD-dependent deacetylase